MFRIRRIFDDLVPTNRYALEQVRTMLREQFELLDRQKIDRIPDALRSPMKYGFRTILYVAEDQKSTVHGLAILDHDDKLNFCYLDYLASDRTRSGRGVGTALYERIRNEALSLGVLGIFFECLPDDPKLSPDPAILKQNKARLKFYESYGARPIINTAYETPVNPGATDPPYLVFDDLSQKSILRACYLKRVIAKILESKYPDICTPAYIKIVVDSIIDNPVLLRQPRYARQRHLNQKKAQSMAAFAKIALVVTDQHHIHHVRERGYVESPARIRLIRQALDTTGMFDPVPPVAFNDDFITAVHDPDYVRYFKRVCRNAEPDTPFYPYVFPIRNRTRPPRDLPIRAGYYCIDTFTPISGHAYTAARRAVECALTAATEILSGRRLAYALVRPPGHHAERGYFGGFCYFNNAAIAAHFLSRFGKVAMLDIDYHHGNGQQEILYQRSDVLTISIHGHPRFAYPYFSGFTDERGDEAGMGFNINYPLPETITPQDYLVALDSALDCIRDYAPTYLVVCLGFDTAKGDPTGTWSHTGRDFAAIGMKIGRLQIPSLFVQEGGYNSRSIGANARNFFQGLLTGQVLPLNRRPL
ncbi:MAG: acetylpolyamine amidohydrolase [Deltaproteobacteria bacterium HGW-Deltaproteobacteria-1]|jgi:acetoin utilization deacetylase AcuC-like enzyme/GNAT superfamily N-acetyltransferase|nr:MAG: acetylpolyamine amidohydrolase [Deltaproteobacteria bacterium HGW-Deltaproteobacteria-1]